MTETASMDARRHVRFAGRPATRGASPSRCGRSSSHLHKPAAARLPARPDGFAGWVFERAGLAVASYRGEALERRIPACLRVLRVHDEAHARRVLEDRPELLPEAVSALLIGVTEFFRDAAMFEALRTGVLPDWVSRGRPVRVWSAGCSNGAELYSVAVLLAEAGLLEGSLLLGSDCRRDAVEQAQAARFPAGELRGVEPSVRRRYFEAAAGRWQPVEALRRQVHWKVADLVRGVEDGPWDLILWRNMAIYLTAEAAADLWRRLHACLAADGVLVVGRAERPPPGIPLIAAGRCVYRVRPGAAMDRSNPASNKTPVAQELSR